jgi:hypothetical protein
MKRAQTATEYLIILAVVIIIALIVVATMGGIPGIGGGVSEQTARAALKTLPVGITDYTFYSFPAKLTISNNQLDVIEVSRLKINTRDCNITAFNLAAGASKSIYCSHATVDERYVHTFSLEYQNKKTSATYVINSSKNMMVGKQALGLNYTCTVDNNFTYITGVQCDFNLDGKTDASDFSIMGRYWLENCSAQNDYCMGADVSCNGRVDGDDTTTYMGDCAS